MCFFHISRTTLVLLQLGIVLSMTAGQSGFGLYCNSENDCLDAGSICYNSKCICEDNPRMHPPCHLIRLGYGDTCKMDADCNFREINLICSKSMDRRTCRCKRGMYWHENSNRCHSFDETSYINVGDKFDPTRDVIIPSVILMTLGATAWLCFKLFCNNCGKSWRRRRRPIEGPRALEEAPIQAVGPSQPTWVASYRVFGPVNGVDTRSFPPCLFLPAGPPPYEEALKHKVILSSYQPPPAVPPLEHVQL